MLENDFGSEVICYHFENDADATATVATAVGFVLKFLLNTFNTFWEIEIDAMQCLFIKIGSQFISWKWN